MTNATLGFGFQPTRKLDGSTPNAQLQEREISSSNTNKIYQYDPIIAPAAGYIDVAAATDHPILGVFEGVDYYDTALNQWIFLAAWLGVTTGLAGSIKGKFTPATPNQLFKARSSGTKIGVADLGAVTKCVANAGDAGSLQSRFTLDQSNLNTTNTFPFLIWDVNWTGDGNDPTLDNNIVEVVIVNNVATSTTGI